MGDILVIGSMNVDMTIRVKELPKTGETILARNLSFGLGGKGANQAMAAARLGGKVRMLGCVGDDDFGISKPTGPPPRGALLSVWRKTEATVLWSARGRTFPAMRIT